MSETADVYTVPESVRSWLACISRKPLVAEYRPEEALPCRVTCRGVTVIAASSWRAVVRAADEHLAE